ncbi:hypothetical protein PILCRDRAFT_829885 [Piloderma croceum F 1598]|uniref:EF-hand domain-containing protein n=1 Tax=Piloderma croceum (strain F 1598) TaxID=765440 RepID=A0A0C3EW82_PILCF|nr:hypothetical protein PILCRDRAFT_829885 [Piloderma croceum F 1598]
MFFTASILIIFITLSQQGLQPARAECCPCPYIECLDGTLCTPYCGYGPCNIFGCNCDNGCRVCRWSTGCDSSLEKFSLSDDKSRDFYWIADTNRDGKMTFAEWQDSTARSTRHKANDLMLFEQWTKYDTVNVGYLTEDEAVNRRA